MKPFPSFANKIFQLLRVSAPLIACGFWLAACGGSSSSSPNSPPPVTTYSIAGTVSGSVASGVTMTLSGAASATTSSAADGTYSFTKLANGSYTVTPTLAGYTFTPSSSAVSVSGANVSSENFTATAVAATYSISGTIAGTVTNGVTLTLAQNGTHTGSTSSAGGAYSFTNIANGTYTVTPSLAGFTFSPASASVTISGANQTVPAFTASAVPVTYSISGTVTGAVTSGVTINLTGAATASTTTASNGTYSVTGLANGTYTVTPSATGYTFSPASASITISGGNITTGANFASAAVITTYSLSGTITGPYVAGISVALSGAAIATTTTNASGNYSFTGLAAGSYTVTPALTGYTYTPSSNTATLPGTSTINFAGNSSIASATVSGTITYAGSKAGPVYVTLMANGSVSGGTQAASGAGSYTIRGVPPGTYSVFAYLDVLGNAEYDLADPAMTSLGSLTVVSGTPNYTANVTLTDPAAFTTAAPAAPGLLPISATAAIAVAHPLSVASPSGLNADGAASYKLYWGTDAAASSGTPITLTGAGQNDGMQVFLTGLTSGATLYAKVTALDSSGTEGPASPISSAVLAAPAGGGATLSGNLTFNTTVAGPAFVGVSPTLGGAGFGTFLATATSPQPFSFAGVTTPGNYIPLYWIRASAGNGQALPGDLVCVQFKDDDAAFSVSGSAATMNINVPTTGAQLRVSSQNYAGQYGLFLHAMWNAKAPVKATIVSGPGFSVPLDLGVDPSNGRNHFTDFASVAAAPTTSDTYVFLVTYSDGTSETLSRTVPGLVTSLPLNLTNPANGSGNVTPTLTWSAPASPPAIYHYYVSVFDSTTGTTAWQSKFVLAPATTSIVYGTGGSVYQSSLTVGHQYTWSVTVVDDANGDQGAQIATYTP